MQRLFEKIPDIAFIFIVAQYPKRGRYMTMEDQRRALELYCHSARFLN